MLTGPERAPLNGESPKKLIVLLHGLGADGNDLIGLAEPLSPLFPDAQFLSPNAPQPCDMAPWGHQWFSLQDRRPEAMLAGAKATAPALNNWLDAQLARFGLSDGDMALIGFSQGTMMALYAALRRTQPCAGIVGFSGALVGHDLPDEITARPPVCLIHGDADEVVPYQASMLAEQALKAAGVPVMQYRRPGLGHGIDNEGLSLAVDFLQEVIGEGV